MSRRFQFSLRTLLLAFAVVDGCIVFARETYFVQLRTVASVVAEFPEIDQAWLCTNYDVTFEVDGLWFSVVDQPGVVYGIGWGIDDLSDWEIRKRLTQALVERHAVELPYSVNYRLR